jgi:hypothetical protein
LRDGAQSAFEFDPDFDFDFDSDERVAELGWRSLGGGDEGDQLLVNGS